MIRNTLKYNNKITSINNIICIINGIFMVFIVCSKAEKIDTMRGKLMLAWYQRT